MKKMQNMNVKKKGFTLIEVMVVLVILAIIAAIAVPSAINYIEKSNQNARIETARAIFNVAQNAMTKKYAKGDEDQIVADGKVAVQNIDPAINSDEVTKNKLYIRYISLNKSTSNKKDNEVYKLLDNYLSDKSVLDETILIEYNVKTGKVLSAFYSDEENNIGYTADNEYDVYTRDNKTLAKNKTGYWAVDSTGKVDGTSLDDITVDLVDYDGTTGVGHDINNGNNYGLLTCEMLIPSALPEAYNYEISLNPEKGSSKTIEIGPGKSIEWNDINDNIEDAINGNGLYLYENNGEKILVLILDTPYEAYSITKKFPKIGIGNMTASLKASIEGDSNTVASQATHAYFSKQEAQGTTNKYEVSSVRHLNNVRYDITQNATYQQTKDIKCRDYKDDVLIFNPIAVNTTVESDAGAFYGNYNGSDDNGRYKIFDLTETRTDMTGLFGKVSSKSVISGITLDYSKAYMSDYERASTADKAKYFLNGSGANVGTICGMNNGKIINCSVNGGIVTSTATASTPSSIGAYVGGIAGSTRAVRGGNPSIEKCYVGADVRATKNTNITVGGIVGFTFGHVKYCEVGTDRDENGFVGNPYFGANIPADSSYPKDKVKNSVVTISGTNCVGGIAGHVQRASYLNYPEITGCVNAAKCINESKMQTQGTYLPWSPTGGIVGTLMGGYIEACYNAGDISCKAPKGLNAGGVVGIATVNSSNLVESCYNTGSVEGISAADNTPTTRNASVGGILGSQAYGKAKDSYNIGKVVGSSDVTTGGAIGIRGANATISNTASLDSEPENTEVDEFSKFYTKEEMKTHGFAGLTNGGTVGEFEYPYPHLNVNNTNCDLGESFHRTPWE